MRVAGPSRFASSGGGPRTRSTTASETSSEDEASALEKNVSITTEQFVKEGMDVQEGKRQFKLGHKSLDVHSSLSASAPQLTPHTERTA
jgi:hypothetical protein